MHDTQADIDFNAFGESTHDVYAGDLQEASGNVPDDADIDPDSRALEASSARGRVLARRALAALRKALGPKFGLYQGRRGP